MHSGITESRCVILTEQGTKSPHRKANSGVWALSGHVPRPNSFNNLCRQQADSGTPPRAVFRTCTSKQQESNDATRKETAQELLCSDSAQLFCLFDDKQHSQHFRNIEKQIDLRFWIVCNESVFQCTNEPRPEEFMNLLRVAAAYKTGAAAFPPKQPCNHTKPGRFSQGSGPSTLTT
jgi:hypothetical protein